VRHDQVPVLELHLRIEEAEERIAAQLEPNGQPRVVDVAQAVHVAEAGSDGFGEHDGAEPRLIGAI